MRFSFLLLLLVNFSALAADELPAGPYKKSCVACEMRDNQLFCACRDSGGEWMDAGLADIKSCGKKEIYYCNNALQCGSCAANGADNSAASATGNNPGNSIIKPSQPAPQIKIYRVPNHAE